MNRLLFSSIKTHRLYFRGHKFSITLPFQRKIDWNLMQFQIPPKCSIKFRLIIVNHRNYVLTSTVDLPEFWTKYWKKTTIYAAVSHCTSRIPLLNITVFLYSIFRELFQLTILNKIKHAWTNPVPYHLDVFNVSLSETCTFLSHFSSHLTYFTYSPTSPYPTLLHPISPHLSYYTNFSLFSRVNHVTRRTH